MIGYEVEKKLEGIQDEPDPDSVSSSGSNHRPADHLDVLPTPPPSGSDRSEMIVFALIMVVIVLISSLAAVFAGLKLRNHTASSALTAQDPTNPNRIVRYVLTKSNIESYLPVKAKVIETAGFGLLEFPEGKMYIIAGEDENRAFPDSDIEAAMKRICPQIGRDNCDGFSESSSPHHLSNKIITEYEWDSSSEPHASYRAYHLQFSNSSAPHLTIIADDSRLYSMIRIFINEATPLSP